MSDEQPTRRQLGQRKRREKSRLERESKRTLCECGCQMLCNPGRKWMSGHNSKSEKEKSVKRERFYKLWGEGRFEDRKVWTEGLTKETSEKLAATGKKISVAFTSERREKYSKWAKENSIKPPTGSGSEHPNWKGGVANLYQMLYRDVKLSNEWKLVIFRRDNFTCQHCGKRSDLHVHHNVEKMSKIVEMFRKDVDITLLKFDEKVKLVSQIVDYHITNSVSGITLCRSCHNKLHAAEKQNSRNLDR